MSAIPKYFLYGESARDVDQQFLHIETLDARSRKHEWSIRPHVHGELHHLLFIEQGSGVIDIDTDTFNITAAMLVSVPAQCVHGFQFECNTEGWIITSSSALLRRMSLAHSDFARLLYQSALLTLTSEQRDWFKAQFLGLAREVELEQVAYRAAAEGALLSILANAIRIKLATDNDALGHNDSDVDLVLRYKHQIDKLFRGRIGAMEYAARLCVCHETLRSACVRITGSSPLALLNARRLLEAKRCLIYSNMSIAEVAYQSGFEDPAYFSRFFTRSAGTSPRDYRLSHMK